MKEQKIAFFDLDGTVTSDKDGSIPDSAVLAIQRARENGHLMFVNTGRCFHNVEKRFRDIGFDGYVCGCGTNIFYGEKELFHITQTHEVTMEILAQARKTDVEILFESKEELNFDLSRKLRDPGAVKLYYEYKERHYDMSHELESEDYICDKFVIWFASQAQLREFRKVSDKYFECIDRGGSFREFVPYHYSKATGIQYLVDYFSLDLEHAYAFGDSNNDLPMLSYVPHSVVMGNAMPEELKEHASFVTKASSEDGIAYALEKLGFFE